LKKTLVPLPAGYTGDAELNQLLGERRAFSRVADSCSAADAQCLRRMRDERMYKSKGVNWPQFCTQYLDISKTEANRIIQRFEEFGESYFDVSRIVRISPEGYRAIAPAVKDKAIEWNGETIALVPENSHRIAAAVQALRQAAATKPAKPAIEAAADPAQRIDELQKQANGIAAELRQLCHSAKCDHRHRQRIRTIAHDLRGRLYDLEVAAA